MKKAPSIDPIEVERFERIADEWWNLNGPMAPLHHLNPTRLRYSRMSLCNHYDLDSKHLRPLAGLRLLDVGCGGGLLTEPFARMGAKVTGIDVGAENIAVAEAHARKDSLEIEYRVAAAEDVANSGEQFDIVISMEVVEHVTDIANFIGTLVKLTKPGGILLLATLNRTFASFLFAILGAEFMLRLLPVGTHNWHRFSKPAEIGRHLRRAGAELRNITGMRYFPRQGEWNLSPNTSVNYLVHASRPN